MSLVDAQVDVISEAKAGIPVQGHTHGMREMRSRVFQGLKRSLAREVDGKIIRLMASDLWERGPRSVRMNPFEAAPAWNHQVVDWRPVVAWYSLKPAPATPRDDRQFGRLLQLQQVLTLGRGANEVDMMDYPNASWLRARHVGITLSMLVLEDAWAPQSILGEVVRQFAVSATDMLVHANGHNHVFRMRSTIDYASDHLRIVLDVLDLDEDLGEPVDGASVEIGGWRPP